MRLLGLGTDQADWLEVLDDTEQSDLYAVLTSPGRRPPGGRTAGEVLSRTRLMAFVGYGQASNRRTVATACSANEHRGRSLHPRQRHRRDAAGRACLGTAARCYDRAGHAPTFEERKQRIRDDPLPFNKSPHFSPHEPQPVGPERAVASSVSARLQPQGSTITSRQHAAHAPTHFRAGGVRGSMGLAISCRIEASIFRPNSALDQQQRRSHTIQGSSPIRSLLTA